MNLIINVVAWQMSLNMASPEPDRLKLYMQSTQLPPQRGDVNGTQVPAAAQDWLQKRGKKKNKSNLWHVD